MSNTKLDFKHILIVSPVSKRSKGLANVLQKYLPHTRFSFLSHAHLLLDKQLEGLDIDLMIIELSKSKSAIYNWYSKDSQGDSLPSAIFLGHPASISDAGHFYRAGASDYLSLSGLKSSHLLRSLVITSSMVEKRKAAPENKQPDVQGDSDKPFSLKEIEKAQPPSTNAANSEDNETRAEFLNTGIISILDRETIKKMSEDSSV